MRPPGGAIESQQRQRVQMKGKTDASVCVGARAFVRVFVFESAETICSRLVCEDE